jgi:hypothetical protein
MSVCFSPACVSWVGESAGRVPHAANGSITDHVPNSTRPNKAPLKTFDGSIGVINQRDHSYGSAKHMKTHIGHM